MSLSSAEAHIEEQRNLAGAIIKILRLPHIMCRTVAKLYRTVPRADKLFSLTVKVCFQVKHV